MPRIVLPLLTLALTFGCGDRSEPEPPASPASPVNTSPPPTPSEPEIEPTVRAPDPQAEPSPSKATGAAEPLAAPLPEPEAEERTRSSGSLRPHATVTAEPDERLRFGVVYRLAHAIGLPGIHIHGRPTPVGDGRHVVVISFAGAPSAWNGMAALRPAVWLIRQDDDGTTRRIADAMIPHVPTEDYHAVAVGEAPEGHGFTLHTARVADLDHDGRPEFEMVIDVDDEVVCGPGLLTHRFFMVYNLHDELDIAADIPLSESTQLGQASRGTVRWLDHNDDGHPDLHLRLKECTEGWYNDDSCRRESTTHHDYLWDSAADRWHLGDSGSVPCGS